MLIEDNKTIIFAVSLIISFIILKIPFIGKYFKVVDTLIHETGHAVVALLTNGEVVSIELFSDTSGITKTKTKGFFSRFFVAISGYFFSSAVAYLFLYMVKNNNSYWIVFYILSSISIINLILWVRNIYGIMWIIIFNILIFIIFKYASHDLQYIFSVIISSILLLESVSSSFTILKMSFKNPSLSGDAKILNTSTKIHPFFWGIFFFLQSIFFLYISINLFIPDNTLF